MKNTRAVIKDVLSVQSKAILESRKSVDASYERAVDIMFRCRGKIVVTGIGKSGVIAQKIASTMSSTGTPAVYMHPSEGLHGSVGVVQKQDVVLAIGKSGESVELLGILPVIKRIGARVIALTANRVSALARASDLVLHMPVRTEACPLNLAPTTSTTVALVIGDALAIALMRRRGFTSESFALFHPGGLLGKRLLMKVSDVMRSGARNPVVRQTASMRQLLVEITNKWTGAASVVDLRGRLLGLVTDFDIRRALVTGRKLESLSITDIMTRNPTCVRDTDLAAKALAIMEKRSKPFTVLPVIDGAGRAVGMLHLHDLVREGLVSAEGERP